MCLIGLCETDPKGKKKRMVLERLTRMLDQLREEDALKEREFYGAGLVINAQRPRRD
jgi:hypothetical protein